MSSFSAAGLLDIPFQLLSRVEQVYKYRRKRTGGVSIRCLPALSSPESLLRHARFSLLEHALRSNGAVTRQQQTRRGSCGRWFQHHPIPNHKISPTIMAALLH